jgi:hypothetical protein
MIRSDRDWNASGPGYAGAAFFRRAIYALKRGAEARPLHLTLRPRVD